MVEETGHNAWLEEVEEGENQTYLLLHDPLAVGNLIDSLLCT